MTHISVIIPTYNRPQLLKNTLDRLINQTYRKTQYEIIIVDNYYLSNAKDVLNKNIKLPVVKVIELSKRSVNNARNEGIKRSSGEIIVFCDDDVLVDRDFLKNIFFAHKKYKNAWAIGGRVKIIWEGGKPAWLPKRVESYYAKLDFGNKEIRNPSWLVSANISFKKQVFKKVGYFNLCLGRSELGNFYKDEIELLNRIKKANGNIYYIPDIQCHHYVSKERLTILNLLRRIYWKGRSEAVLENQENRKFDKILGNLFFTAVLDVIYILYHIMHLDKDKIILHCITPVYMVGFLMQSILIQFGLVKTEKGLRMKKTYAK